jgi:dolichol-phosphate mannosyltransferase
LPRLISEDADLVIGSRYVPGGDTPGWPFKRRLISRCGGIFIRTVTGMPLRDPTGGFKCWSAEALKKIDFKSVASAGYSFQLEMNHRAWKAGCSIKEIPIVFTDRVAGYSKISAGIAVESVKIALRLRFGKI